MLAQRERSLLRFEWPIFAASLFDTAGATAFDILYSQGVLPRSSFLLSLCFPLPGIVVLYRDLRRTEDRGGPPKFSLTHCLFFIHLLPYLLNYFLLSVHSLTYLTSSYIPRLLAHLLSSLLPYSLTPSLAI